MIAANERDSFLPHLDPILRRYSDKQLAVATTWANHFCVPPEHQRRFIRQYLQATTPPAVWAIQFEYEGRSVAFARVGRILQWFDGTIVRTTACEGKHRVPRRKPELRTAQALAGRIETLPLYADGGLLTSFAQKARDWATELARSDLGERSALVAGLDTQSPHLRYLRPRSQYYLRLIGAALREFNSALDPEILFAIRSVQCVSPQLYNWLASGEKQRRLQALRAQPVLIPMLILGAHHDTFPWPHNDQGFIEPSWPELNGLLTEPRREELGRPGLGLLAEATDRGLPLNEVLAWLLQAPKASVRYLGSCRPGRAGGALFHIQRAGHEAWGRMLVGASLGNRRPRSKADWLALYSLMNNIPYSITMPHYRASDESVSIDWNVLLKGCPGSWSDPGWPEIEGTLADFQEFYRHLDHAAQYTGDVATRFFITRSYAQIARKVHQFHEYVDEVQKALDQEFGVEWDELQQTWSALLPMGTVQCPNGITVVELRCPADLMAEHTSMKHCIDTYDYSAFVGDCRLVSFRQGNAVLASAEIQLARHVDSSGRGRRQQFQCVQLRGPRNQPIAPTSAAGQASRWFMRGLESGRIQSSQEWPDQTSRLKRYAQSERAQRLSGAVQAWILENMGGQP
ncbi:hypothetical protein [Pseudomonas soli]|uniref:hypothetical protein n=1 Tax=Pseudomonas soli TaxID=1306993 RepID=UPI00299D3412|nr:hypothetical protein [Pseudomonas soli]MDW9405624.1 hypothetical protein [Pseudomonas soli]